MNISVNNMTDIDTILKEMFEDKIIKPLTTSPNEACINTVSVNSAYDAQIELAAKSWFDDDTLMYLLKDTMEQKAKEAEEILKREVEKGKRQTIDKFIQTIKYVDIDEENEAVIVWWLDGSKTVVRCQPGDKFDAEKGLAMAIIKALFGNTNYFNTIFKVLLED